MIRHSSQKSIKIFNKIRKKNHKKGHLRKKLTCCGKKTTFFLKNRVTCPPPYLPPPQMAGRGGGRSITGGTPPLQLAGLVVPITQHDMHLILEHRDQHTYSPPLYVSASSVVEHWLCIRKVGDSSPSVRLFRTQTPLCLSYERSDRAVNWRGWVPPPQQNPPPPSYWTFWGPQGPKAWPIGGGGHINPEKNHFCFKIRAIMPKNDPLRGLKPKRES